MKIQSFKTWCKRKGITPCSGYTNLGWVETKLTDSGYKKLGFQGTKNNCLEYRVQSNVLPKSAVTLRCRANNITDVVYYYYIRKNTGEDIYHIHIFYKGAE